MRRINEYHFYQLATMLRPLADVTVDAPISDYLFVFFSAKNWLDFLLDDLLVPINVCRGPINNLRDAIQNALNAYEKDKEAKLSFHLAYPITNGLSTFEPVFAAELQTVDTYFVSQTGIYSTPDLIERAERVFPEKIRKAIPDHAVKDIRQAGRCLAFGLPTGAAFHILRATEALIVEYYEIVVGNKPKMKSRNWGRYIEHIRNHNGDQKIITALDQIREMHRNPIMHPEDFLSDDEAVTLFGVAQGVIVAMAVDIEKRTQVTAAAKAVTAGVLSGLIGGNP